MYTDDDEIIRCKGHQRHLYTQCHLAKLAGSRARHARDHSGVATRGAYAAAAIAHRAMALHANETVLSRSTRRKARPYS
jgi:hypothetical protein